MFQNIIRNIFYFKITIILGLITTFNIYGYEYDNNSIERNYFKINAGYSHPDGKHSAEHATRPKGSFMLSTGVGYIFSPTFRADITAGYIGKYKYRHIKNAIREEQDIYSTLAMVNIYWYFKNLYDNNINYSASFFPYFTIGFGYATITSKDVSITNENGQNILLGLKKDGFAWQIGLGSLLRITKHLDMDFAYKYVYLGKHITTHNITNAASIKDVRNMPPVKNLLRAHEFSIGLQFKFNTMKRL